MLKLVWLAELVVINLNKIAINTSLMMILSVECLMNTEISLMKKLHIMIFKNRKNFYRKTLII